MNHVQQRVMERLGESITIEEIKRLCKSIINNECKHYLDIGKTIGIYQVFVNGTTEGVAVFDKTFRHIKTIGHPRWIKKKGGKFIFIEKKQKEKYSNNNYDKKNKEPYDRTKQKRKDKKLLQGYVELLD